MEDRDNRGRERGRGREKEGGGERSRWSPGMERMEEGPVE